VCEDESVAVLRALTPLLHRDHVAEAVHSVVYLLTFAPLAAEQQQQQHAKPRASEKRTGDLWFLVRVMEAEVAGTTVATGLFRETTALSAVLSAYAHLVCRRFLRATLEPPLRPVLCGVIPTSTPQVRLRAAARHAADGRDVDGERRCPRMRLCVCVLACGVCRSSWPRAP